jgi:hypothetical protein
MRRIVLKSHLALGDIACLTAVPRELHAQYPGQFEIDVRTPFPDLWWHSPHITSLDDSAEQIDCHYDRDAWESVNRTNQHPTHMITAYCQDVANSLGITLRPTTLAGDIHLSREEWGWKSMPHEHHNCQRYWVIAPGGKTDFTTKIYPAASWQRVIDYFAGRIQFVAVGSLGPGQIQPQLQGVIDLRGQTDVRQLIRVIHSACGVLCGITSVMHLAAAVPRPPWQRRPRPCVVVAGGREPRTWYGYPTHRILETVGTLPCCSDGGCWHARTVPLNDGHDDRLCERVRNNAPACMLAIRPEQVILAIEQYLDSEGIE